MSNELDSQLAALIESARQTGSDVASFIQQQAPELCQQVIAWEVWSNGLYFAIGAAFAIAGGFLAPRLGKKASEAGYQDDIPYVIGCAMSIVGIIIGSIVSLVSFGPFIKAIVAPKLVLLDKIAELLK